MIEEETHSLFGTFIVLSQLYFYYTSNNFNTEHQLETKSSVPKINNAHEKNTVFQKEILGYFSLQHRQQTKIHTLFFKQQKWYNVSLLLK